MMKHLMAVFILHFGLHVETSVRLTLSNGSESSVPLKLSNGSESSVPLKLSDGSESSVPLTLSDGSGNYAGLCPYREFCTSKSEQNITYPAKTSCCQKCSCSATCYEVGSCCPDMPDVGNKEPKYICQDINTFQPKTSFALVGKTGISFRVVNDCPNKILSEKYSGCLTPTHLKDFIFVSDLTDERIYRNYQCAQCNGVTDVIHWQVSVSECNDLFFRQFNSLVERDKYIVANCIVIPVQPVAEIGAMSRCIDKGTLLLTKYCPNLPIQNQTIKQLCEKNISSTNTLFNEYTAGSHHLYPNIFCYFCSIGDIQIDAGCVKSKYVIETKLTRVSFTGLITFEETFSENDYDIHACNYSSIWDPFTERCRPLYCKLGTIPVGGQCRPSLQSVSGIVFSLVFPIEIETVFLNRSLKIFNTVDDFMQKALHDYGLYCNLCRRVLFRLKNTNNSNLFYDFNLYSSDICSSGDVLTWARLLLKKGTNTIQIEDEGFVFQIQLKMSVEPIGEEGRQYIKFVHPIRCANAIQLIDWMFLDCPFLRVNAENLTDIGLVNPNLNDRNKVRAVKINNSSDIAICVKDYFSFQSSGSGATKPQIYCKFLFLLTLYFFRFGTNFDFN